MRFKDIELEDFSMDTTDEFSFYVPCTDELVEESNKIRMQSGHKDLVTVDCDNDVYYNYYLIVDIKKQTVSLMFTTNNSEKDDYVARRISLTRNEEYSLLHKVVIYLLFKEEN